MGSPSQSPTMNRLSPSASRSKPKTWRATSPEGCENYDSTLAAKPKNSAGCLASYCYLKEIPHKKSTIHCFIHSFYYSSIYQNEIRDIEGWHWIVDFCVKIINHPFEFRYVLSFSFVFSSQMLGVFSCFNTTLVAPWALLTLKALCTSHAPGFRAQHPRKLEVQWGHKLQGIAGGFMWFPSEVQLYCWWKKSCTTWDV